MVMCLSQGVDLHMTQMMPLSLTVSCSGKSRLVLPFWCWLTWVVPDKIQESRITVVCVCVCVRACVRGIFTICCFVSSLLLYVVSITHIS